MVPFLMLVAYLTPHSLSFLALRYKILNRIGEPKMEIPAKRFHQKGTNVMPRKAAAVQADSPIQLPVPSPLQEYTVADMRAEFARISRKTPRDKAAEQAFLAGRMHMLRTHPGLSVPEREAAAARLTSRLSRAFKAAPGKVTPPTPGGVGYGMFYDAPFKTNFTTGTSLYWEIICPNPPGGNVNTYLYLTATNRSAMGVEAFISYNGQSQTTFRVYDWARSDPWQTNIPFSNLGPYLRTESAHGHPYQVLNLLNSTAQSGDKWINQVWLFHHDRPGFDIVYFYAYAATLAQQTAGFVGSWGPIVETFQDSYVQTQPMGALNTQLVSSDNNEWGAWSPLSASDSYSRVDNKGFFDIFLDANSSWAVRSFTLPPWPPWKWAK
jgi:hypothetical protein